MLYKAYKDWAEFMTKKLLNSLHKTWKNNHEILAALQYKTLYNISRSEKWVKKNTRLDL